MSLPTINFLSDTISLDKTVYPYLKQLSVSHVLPLLKSEISPKEWYLTTNPFITAILLSLVVAVIVLIAAEINRNYSQVDRLWSLLPTFYIGHYALYAHLKGLHNERLFLLLLLSVLWSIRLTFNYWRKGGYTIGSEDYRWKIVKDYIGEIAFFILDVTFIALYQNLLLVSIASPAYVILLASQNAKFAPLNISDYIVFGAGVIFIIFEFFADQQQWDYQTAKHQYKETGKVPQGFSKEDLDRGFVVNGLWAYSRHPNCFGEQAFWVVVYLWTVALTGTFNNWTGICAALYCSLFQGGTLLTEFISAGKYPQYKEYQKVVSKFVPGFSRWTNQKKATNGKTETKKTK